MSLKDQSWDHSYSLIYINDVAMVPISQDSKLNLFADDVLLYKIISTMEDYTATQGDINAIADWSDNNTVKK